MTFIILIVVVLVVLELLLFLLSLREFGVGLRQGWMMSSWLFTIYVQFSLDSSSVQISSGAVVRCPKNIRYDKLR